MGTLDLYNVLDKLKQIENPTEDQQQAIKQTEAMTQKHNRCRQTYKPVQIHRRDLGRLAGKNYCNPRTEPKEDEDVARLCHE